MAVKDQVMELLEENRGSYISGETLAETLNVSRAAVWKAIRKLQECGYEIEGVNNKGYRLAEDTDRLTRDGVLRFLDARTDVCLEVYPTVSSTNLVLKDRADEPEGLVIAASQQTHGMGRLGRTFVSPAETGIYFSILLKPKMSNEDITLLTTIAATAVCEAIETCTQEKPVIKWVNDVFLRDRKICGILTQASFNMENLEPEYVIVGIGINLYQPEGGFGQELQSIAGSLMDTKVGNLKNRLLAEVLNRYMYYYRNFEEKAFIEEYRKRSFVIGREIRVVTPQGEREAHADDIDDKCHLLVTYPDGTKEVLSTGEISIRLK
ncbi:MAG: biotin--[acetyl-CoA-carboxylase] ligase [Wujia sp.]